MSILKQKLENKPLTVVGDGAQKRFLYVSDVTKAFYIAAKSKKVGEFYNLGASKPQSIKKLSKIIGVKLIIYPKARKPECTWANINKIKRLKVAT